MDNTKESIQRSDVNIEESIPESEENKYKDESEEEYSSGSEWDSEDESDEEYKTCSTIRNILESLIKNNKSPIIATDTDGNETTFENSYQASEILGIGNADIIKCCKNIRGYEYCTVDDKKYSFREK